MRVLLQLLLLPLLASASPVTNVLPTGNDVCLDESSLPSVAINLNLNANAPATGSDVSEKKDLPVFFFHGLTGNSTEGFNYQANLTAEGRVFVPLAFCERECSLTALNIQVPMAIAAVREVVANDERFADGYIFLGHSQGAMMARAVIEQMDDHKVHTFVSLAGGVNGIFYGPQEADRNSIHDLGAGFGAAVLPQSLFDFTGYTSEGYRGKMQADLARRSMDPKLHAAYSITNLGRTPVRDVWLLTNEFLPMINNVNTCAWFDFHCHLEKIRRRNNFLRLKEAHFFASPEDGVASPWQGSLLGHYPAKSGRLKSSRRNSRVSRWWKCAIQSSTRKTRMACARWMKEGHCSATRHLESHTAAGCMTFRSFTRRVCASFIRCMTSMCATCLGRTYRYVLRGC